MYDFLFPKTDADLTPETLAAKYPPRTLSAGAMVTRIAPSPTGFMHVGSLYTALVCERLAHQSGGVFYLRIEDTDKKREVEGTTQVIVAGLAHFGVKTDEGEQVGGAEVGAYGPYKQSARGHIYMAYVRQLLGNGKAYPCFCTPEALEEQRQLQENMKIRPGYYGEWAKCRTLSEDDARARMADGKAFVIRFRSPGDPLKKVAFVDAVKGKRELPENDQDIVIMKSDGLPTYHFAHAVDDHLMGTTHVVRGDEWFISVALHLQLFEALGWQPPTYGHLAPIQKIDGASRRKLSKRKDPEASVSYYDEQGYPDEAVIDYLLNLANSSFEEWRKANPDADFRTFPFSMEKLANSAGALFDLVKLNDISKNVVAKYDAQKVYACALAWAQKHDAELAALLTAQADYARSIFGIERGDAKARKDLAKWSDVRNEIAYFFDDRFSLDRATAVELIGQNAEEVAGIVAAFEATYDPADDKDAWFEKIKAIARERGYAESAKEFKAAPEKFKGNVGDVAKTFRVLLTGRAQTPDLHSIMRVMGKERVLRRLAVVR